MAAKTLTEFQERPARAFKKVVCIMPAYNAESTLERTLTSIPLGSVDEYILTDDCSRDHTADIAERLGMTVLRHEVNRGYGANQKTCYDAALERGADVIIMIHPDYQYDGRITPAVVQLLATGTCDMILGSRIRTRRETLEGGMPVYKYLSNRLLTAFENVMLGQNLGDFHSGYRAYVREVLETINYHANSDDFVFDTEFLAQAVYQGFRIGDVPIPTRYFSEASSINFRRSSKYGLQTIGVMLKYHLQRLGLVKYKLFEKAASPAPTLRNVAADNRQSR
jgi:glycosyltransferase involved in cell wall biosynthesis